jgi:2-polyprenyl-6-hydroxyphenyl methylase/3-demethylubiquinone-9 3-methyltransferase
MMQTSIPRTAGDETARFAFGENWRRFLEGLTPARIADAEASLKRMFRRDSVEGLRFLDVGSGSGLFSLAARRLGARVVSFDYDPTSVACTAELRRRYFPNDADWRVEQGSVLGTAYLATLGRFEVVYSWGVLHHTGDMWSSLANIAALTTPGGLLGIAIYNDQGWMSRVWASIKRTYNRLSPRWRWMVLAPSMIALWGPLILRDALRGEPLKLWRDDSGGRGMSARTDLIDWVGGWPFEVAKPERIFDFYRDRGFTLVHLKTCGGRLGCNEFTFATPEA